MSSQHMQNLWVIRCVNAIAFSYWFHISRACNAYVISRDTSNKRCLEVLCLDISTSIELMTYTLAFQTKQPLVECYVGGSCHIS